VTRRSLILAGGGVKVAFQAGVLQVWLDEAGIEFDHADGASGGVFNLAMYCQGMSGTAIADNWRSFRPLDGVSLNWREYPKLVGAASLFTLDRFRAKVFPKWGLDWAAIRKSPREATFNVYNFTRGRLEVLNPADMTEDLLVAAVSLPMWFPPVVVNRETYIDSVFVTDANLEEAIDRGADELWVIWTVSEAGQWSNGFVANYFQIIEAAACGNFHRALERIAEGAYGRKIDVHILRAEVPLHYLLNMGADRNREAVELGVKTAREWCRDRGIDLAAPRPPAPSRDPVSVTFTEQMSGDVGSQPMMFRLDMLVDDVGRVVVDPDHELSCTGVVTWGAVPGDMRVEQGVVNLLVDEGTPWEQRMLYRLFLVDREGKARTLSGVKTVRNDPGMDLWRDTTVLRTRIFEGRVAAEDEAEAPLLAEGELRLSRWQFLRQLSTFRGHGPTRVAALQGIRRFAQMFLGRLWDVYGRKFLSSSPI
jgi:predicted patatin/cPLA2 family phospholipase